MVCAYLLFTRSFYSVAEAISYFDEIRHASDLDWHTPTLTRFLHYVQNTLNLNGCVPNMDPIKLARVILNLNAEVDFVIHLEIVSDEQLIYSSQNKLTVSHNYFNVDVDICGSFLLRFFYLTKEGMDCTICRFALNSNFITKTLDVLRMDKTKLDLPHVLK